MIRGLTALFAGAAALVACSTAGVQSFDLASSGNYELEKTHASLIWRVSHNGLSNYTVRFTEIDADLVFDPDNPENSSVEAIINPLSVDAHHPNDREGWNNTIATGNQWLNGDQFPQIIFRSTRIERTGEFTGIIYGDLTLLGVTNEVALETTYNGTGNAPWFGTRDLIGFSARGVVKRSEFGMTALLPEIGDEVEVIIEAEFLEK